MTDRTACVPEKDFTQRDPGTESLTYAIKNTSVVQEAIMGKPRAPPCARSYRLLAAGKHVLTGL